MSLNQVFAKSAYCRTVASLCLVLLVAVVAARGVPAHAASQPERFGLKQIFDLQWAADPRIAPNGKRVVFVRSGFDIMNDDTRHSLWVVGSDGNGLRALTPPDEDASSPRFSPDGTRLIYVVQHEDKAGHKTGEIRMRWMDSGDTARLVSLAHPARALTFSPDGRRIAFAMFVDDPADAPIAKLPEPPKGANWGPEIKVIDRLVYRFDGRGYLARGHTHLFVMTADGGSPQQVTDGAVDDDGSVDWTPDGKHLIFSANRHDEGEYHPLNSEVYEVGADGGAVRALTDRNGPDHSAVVSPDGKHIAYIGFDDRQQGYQVSHLYVMDRDGGHARVVGGDLDRDVENPQWDSNGNGVYFQYDDEGVTRIGYMSLDGKMHALVSDVGGLDLGRPYSGGQYTVAAQAGTIAFTLTSPQHPADVAIIGTRGGDVKRLTDLNAGLFAHTALGTLEEIRFASSFDQLSIEGWILKPPGFDPKQSYPLLLEIHGGPFTNYGTRWSAEDQLYAAAGHVVLYINPRGSTSYGEKFGNLIHHDYPNHDYEDLISAVDAVIKRGYIDPKRLYVTGGSGGGVLTAWIVGHTDRFAAAVVAKPVINWYSWVLTADLPSFGTQYWFAGMPWDNQENYMKRSPVTYAGNVKTPTMVMTGEIDYRTPSSDAEQFYEALKLRKVPSVMVRVPDASHDISDKPSNMMAKVAYILGWFERYGSGKLPAP
jgi:dipeptidyl aminopeptidase/acylaminoacyl peptidase